MTRHRKKLNLQCEFCTKRYTKREHLQDLADFLDTGDKPFACNICGRCFSRQDVLNRHLRVHSSQTPTQGTVTDVGPQITPHGQSGPSEWPSMSDRDAPSDQLPEDCLPMYQTPIEDVRPLPPDLASGLLWPDSEELLQNIMAIDPSIWQQPLALAPSTLGMAEMPGDMMNNGYQDSPSNSTIADDGRHAIQSLSSLISDTFSRVTAPASLTGLTSRFLDGSLHMFFENIIPMFPVFHRPTFVFRDCAPPLLLNAIALGARFLGSQDAIAKADVLWRLAHTAVATSWNTMITRRRPSDSCTGVELVQTVLLSQIYAALSQNRTFRTTSQVFHGLGIHWASHCGMYDACEAVPLPSPTDSPAVIQSAWRRWIAQETMLRTLLGLYIVDGVVSQFSGNPTFARHAANPLPLPSGDAAFLASTPGEWIQQMQAHPVLQVRFCDIYHTLFRQGGDVSLAEYDIALFHHKVVLEGVRCLVSETNRTKPPPVGLPSKKDLLLVLRQLRRNILDSQALTPTDRLTALLQWHSICLDSVVSTARGTRRMCHLFGIKQNIFGGSERQESRINPNRWTQSAAGRATLLHAINMQAIAAQLPLGLAYDVNIPGAVFAAATTYTSFTLAGVSKIVFPASIDWDTALMALQMSADSTPVDDEASMQHTLDFIAGTFDATGMPRDKYVVRDLSYDLTAMRTLLRGLSLQWGVAVEMEEVVSAYIERYNNPSKIYNQFADLRSRCPVAHTSEMGGFYLLTRHEDVKAAASDTETFISSVKAVIPSDPRGIRRPPLNTDPPAHTPYRTALDRTLRPKRLRRIKPLLVEHAEREFAKLVADGGGDICGDFAAIFAAWVETTWLNLEEDTAPMLATTAAAWVNAWRRQDGKETTAQSEKLYGIARKLFADRRIAPRDPEQDPASSLLQETDSNGQPLKDELLIGCLRQSLVVGMVAPPLLFGVMCKHLSDDKQLQGRLRSEPSLIPAAVEEFVRLYVPYRGFCRTPSRDIELRGRLIPAKTPVAMTYAAANRDPEVFENPDDFVLNRPNITSHLGFGRGRHRCAGMPLARMALQIGLAVILRQSADFEVNGPLEYAGMPEMGITSCPLRITPRDRVE
ncbi:cytochrome P450 [Aspergillus pseudodeflectus]|uniref:Cytochrome P450 n=1 Tax=Aspergillus pseudodeflectus TaxID=176178 RepID=A0ABR4JY02_9EURO